MSDMTSLSHQYATNASFAEHINAWVLAIKKASLGVAEGALPSSSELHEARSRLVELLNSAVSRLDAAASGHTFAEGDPDAGCSEDVLERVQERHKADLAWFLQDLRETASTLSQKSALEPRLLTILDEFSDAADGLASESFRRLWRR
jgi:hypothetical protein